MSDEVTYDLEPNGIGLITLNRPAVRNALNWAAMQALHDCVAAAEADANATAGSGLCALIVTGEGGQAFTSGGDIRDLHGTLTEDDGLRQHDLMTGTMDRLANLPVPVIAALEGATRGGGCEIALACDLRMAAEDATLGFAQVLMGVTPGWGGAGRLVRLVGYALAMEILLTGRPITAPDAFLVGLVNRLTPPGKALLTAHRFAAAIAGGPVEAARGIKEVLRGYVNLPPDAARACERSVFARLWAGPDHAEASAAFIEHREPDFH
jgi:enoyl-CoA hydratase